MAALFWEKAIATLTSQNDLPSHLMVCGGKIGKYSGSFHQKRRQKGGCYGKDEGTVQSAICSKWI